MFVSDAFVTNLLHCSLFGAGFATLYLIFALVCTRRFKVRNFALQQLIFRLSALCPLAMFMALLPVDVETKYVLVAFMGPSVLTLIAIDVYSSYLSIILDSTSRPSVSERSFFGTLCHLHVAAAAVLLAYFVVTLSFGMTAEHLLVAAYAAGHAYVVWQLRELSGYIIAGKLLVIPVTPLRIALGV